MDVISKISKIRRINDEKDYVHEERKITARKHQDLLSNYIVYQKDAVIDERPLVYTDDQITSAFKRITHKRRPRSQSSASVNCLQ